MAVAIKPNDVIVLVGAGPLGTGMEETYQLTSALKFIPWGKTVALVTDGRFSGVSTGACIGHVGPEALAGGPIGKLIDGDLIDIVIDRRDLTGQVNLVAAGGRALDAEEARQLLESRPVASRASRARAPSRRHAAVGGAAVGQRRTVGGLRLRRRSDHRGHPRRLVGASTEIVRDQDVGLISTNRRIRFSIESRSVNDFESGTGHLTVSDVSGS